MKTVYIFIFILIVSQQVYAKGKPVTHSHAGRTHTHVLPNNGRGNHNHNNGAQSSNKNKATTTTDNHWIKDQNGCRHYNPNPAPNETIRWTGECSGGYAYGHGKLTWYKDGVIGSKNIGRKISGKFEGEMKVVRKDGSTRIHFEENGETILSGPDINCSTIDVTKEQVACYAVIVGPKVCTEAVVKDNRELTQNIGGRISLSAACTAGVKSTFAQEYVPNDLAWNIADELSETACENRKQGGFLKWAIGGYGCVFSGVSWLTKMSTASSCAKFIEKKCGSGATTKSFSTSKTLNMYLVTATPHLNIRDTPNTYGNIVGNIAYGKRVNVINSRSKIVNIAGKNGHWVRVKHNGVSGYVFDAYLEKI